MEHYSALYNTHDVYDKICSSNVSYSIHFDHPFNNNSIHFVQLWSTFPIAVACEHVQLPYMAWNHQYNAIESPKYIEIVGNYLKHFITNHHTIFRLSRMCKFLGFSSPFRNFQFCIFAGNHHSKLRYISENATHRPMRSNDAVKIIASNENAQLCHQNKLFTAKQYAVFSFVFHHWELSLVAITVACIQKVFLSLVQFDLYEIVSILITHTHTLLCAILSWFLRIDWNLLWIEIEIYIECQWNEMNDFAKM